MPIFDKDKSRIKLWVGTGSSQGSVYYSILSQDKKSDKEIIAKMSKRILEKLHKNNFTTAIFYNNQTGEELKMIIGNNTGKRSVSVNKQTAKIKLWIGFPTADNNDTWYNDESINDFENTEIIKMMTEQILRKKYRYQFAKAIFFDNQLGGIHLKTIEGNLIKK